jgi:hypothetical protein
MNTGKTVFAQLLEHLPYYEFSKCVKRYNGEYKVKSFSCLSQFLSMAFAQLTSRESLRDIVTCLRTQQNKLYHAGFRGKVFRNTLANANLQRDWRIYADFAMVLIGIARQLYAHENFGVQLKKMVYALNSTTIKLCLSLFPWAHFRKRKAAVKMHTLLDLHGSIPSCIWITHGKVHDINILDQLPLEAGAYYLFDRGYLDFAQNPAGPSLLDYAYQKQLSVSCCMLSSRQKILRRSLRSNDHIDRLLYGKKVSGSTAFDSLLRQSYRQTLDIFNQQLLSTSQNHRPSVQVSLENRTVLAVDQAASPDQSILWHVRERGQDTNLDRDSRLCPRSYRQEKAQNKIQPLHHAADPEYRPLRKMPLEAGAYKRIRTSCQRAKR